MGLGIRFRRFSRNVRRTMMPGAGEIGRGERFLGTAVRFLIQIGRQFGQDRCPREAASLAFQTLVAMIPLAAVLLVLTRWVDALGNRPAVERLLGGFVLPEAARDFSERLAAVVQQVDFGAIGWIGGVALAFLGSLLFLQVEDVLNDVWNVPHGRPMWQRAIALVGIVILALPAFAAALYLTVERLAFPLDILGPAVLLAAALTLIYRLLPHVRVRWRSALAGALVATLLLGAGHSLFGLYVDRVRWTYESVYGAVAFVPIGLLWIWLGWVFFLLGAEVSYTSQHLDALWAKARRSSELRLMRQDVVGGTSWPNAVRLAVGVAEAVRAGSAPIDPELAALRFSVPGEAWEMLVSRLSAAGIIRPDPEGRLSLARPASEIRMVEVYDAVVDRRPLAAGPADLPERLRRVFGAMTLADAAAARAADPDAATPPAPSIAGDPVLREGPGDDGAGTAGR